MIEEGNRVAYAYVMANGIGAGLTVSPNYWFIYPQERVVEIGEGDKHAIDLGAGVSYRLNKSIKLGLSFSFKQHDLVKDDRVYSGMQNNLENYDPIGAAALPLYQRDGVPVTGYPLARITDQEIDYFLSQQVATIALTGAFVWPFTREFNVSVGAGPSINIINYVQHYDQILVFVNDGVGFQRRLYQNNFLGLGLKVDVGAEYFVLPRLSVNAGLAYHLIFITNLLEIDASCPTTGDYYYSESFRAIDAFGLNPFELPDGTPLTYDLFSANYLKLYVGATFYF